MGYLSIHGVEGVIFGPGEIEQMHRINGSASVAQIEVSPGLYEKIYFEWAKAGN